MIALKIKSRKEDTIRMSQKLRFTDASNNQENIYLTVPVTSYIISLRQVLIKDFSSVD